MALWHECGKPFDSRTLATYYVSGMWKTSTLYKDLDALKKNMAVRARGFSLGHQLYEAPREVYELIIEHVVEADVISFLSTCKSFARRRTNWYAILCERAIQNKREFMKVMLAYVDKQLEERQARGAYLEANTEEDEQLKEVWDRCRKEQMILFKEMIAIFRYGVWG